MEYKSELTFKTLENIFQYNLKLKSEDGEEKEEGETSTGEGVEFDCVAYKDLKPKLWDMSAKQNERNQFNFQEFEYFTCSLTKLD